MIVDLEFSVPLFDLGMPSDAMQDRIGAVALMTGADNIQGVAFEQRDNVARDVVEQFG